MSESEPESTKAVEPPRFLKPMAGLDVQEGRPAQFEVVMAGEPQPQIQWLREGVVIPQNEDFQMTTIGNRHILFIKEVVPEDSGIFTCRAQNPDGFAECSAELFVEGIYNFRMHECMFVFEKLQVFYAKNMHGVKLMLVKGDSYLAFIVYFVNGFVICI